VRSFISTARIIAAANAITDSRPSKTHGLKAFLLFVCRIPAIVADAAAIRQRFCNAESARAVRLQFASMSFVPAFNEEMGFGPDFSRQ
jgi:hypothetical protein